MVVLLLYLERNKYHLIHYYLKITIVTYYFLQFHPIWSINYYIYHIVKIGIKVALCGHQFQLIMELTLRVSYMNFYF